MSERVAGDAFGFPTAIDFAFRRQSRLLAKPAQQPVQLQAQQILFVAQHRVAERAVEQPHLRQRKRLRLRSDYRWDFAA